MNLQGVVRWSTHATNFMYSAATCIAAGLRTDSQRGRRSFVPLQKKTKTAAAVSLDVQKTRKTVFVFPVHVGDSVTEPQSRLERFVTRVQTFFAVFWRSGHLENTVDLARCA